jgi:crossover junction endodeoxyribonuclease RuvC
MHAPISIGIDLSLTSTGVGVVGTDTHAIESAGIVAECYRYGRSGKRDEPILMRLDRIEAIVYSIEALLTTSERLPLIAVLEAPATAAAGGSAHDRSGLWWLTVKMLRGYGIPVVSVITQHLKIYATGKGSKLDKEEVLLAMVRRHPWAPISNNDEADGLTLAFMGARILGQPLDGKLAQLYTRALDKVTLPEGLDVAPHF